MFSTTIKKGSGLWWLGRKQEGFYSIDEKDLHSYDYGICVVVDWWADYTPDGYIGGGFELRFYTDEATHYTVACPIPEWDEIGVEYVIDLIEAAIDERRTKVFHLAQELIKINKAYHPTYQFPINRQELIEYVSVNNIKLLEGILPMFDNLLNQVLSK